MNKSLPWIAVVLAVIVGVPGLFGEFVLDDPVAVAGSACVTGNFDPELIWSSNFWCEQGGFFSIESWRPFTVTVWWLVHHLSSSKTAFGALCLVLHAANTYLVYRLARHLQMPETAAGWGAIAFATLAIHVDAVATAVGSAELLGALLVLLCLRGFVDGRWWCVPLGALAVLAKESGVLAFALVATLAAVHPSASRFDRQRQWIAAGVLGALSLALLAARAQVLGSWTAQHIPAFVNPLVEASFGDRMLTGVAIVGQYHRLAVLGSPLSADYAAFAVGTGSEASLLDLVVGVLVFVALGALARRGGTPRFLAAWWAGTSLFISNIPFVLPAIFAERLFYLPSVAAALGVAAALQRWTVRPWVARAALIAFVGAQATLAIVHAARYTDEQTIVETTVENTPRNARARMWLAVRQAKDRKLVDARANAQVAASLRPKWGAPLALEAVVDDLEGDPDAALAGFRRAMELGPHDPEVVDPFVQFLIRYGHVEPAGLVYDAHVQARGAADPRVTVPPGRQ